MKSNELASQELERRNLFQSTKHAHSDLSEVQQGTFYSFGFPIREKGGRVDTPTHLQRNVNMKEEKSTLTD